MNTSQPNTNNQDQNEQLSRLLEFVPCGLYDYYLDAQGKSHFSYFNDQLVELFEVSRQELERDASIIWSLFHPEDSAMVAEADKKANKAGSLFFVETRIITRSGKEKWLQISSRPTNTKINGSVVWSGYYLDITAQRIAKSKNQALMKAIPDLILVNDEDGRYLEINDPGYMTHFFPSDFQLIGKTYHDIFPKEIADNYLNFNQQVIKEGGNLYLEYSLISLDGTERFFECSSRPIQDTIDGKKVMISVIRDITEQNRAKAELLAAHEKLRTIQIQEARTEQRTELIRDMHDGFGSQLTHARMMLEKKDISKTELQDLIDDCIADLYLMVDTIREENQPLTNVLIDYRYRIEKRLLQHPVQIDWQFQLQHSPDLDQKKILQILRVLQELLTNSLRHSKATQIRVEVDFDADTRQLTLCVADNGIGMPVNVQPGYGLNNMKIRARVLGAELRFTSCNPGTQALLVMQLQ